jgi:hypothetical protein
MSTSTDTPPPQDENACPARAVTTGLAASERCTHHYDIPLLNDDGNNFASWKFRIQLILKLRGLWTVVDGTYAEPDATVDPTGFANWTRKDLEALAQISFTLMDGPLTYALGANSAKECWERLSTRYGSAQSAVLLMEELSLPTLSESKPLELQIDRLVYVARTLDTLGFPIPDKALAYMIVFKLPDSMETLRTILSTAEPSEISTEAIVSKIIFDERRRGRASGVGTDASFAKAAKELEGLSASEDREKKCAYCDKHGHDISECRKLKKEQESQPASDDREKKCAYCDKHGHDIGECRKLKKEQESQPASDDREKKCAHCNKRGHDVGECRKLKKEQESKGARNPSDSSAAPPPVSAGIGHVPSIVVSSKSTADHGLKYRWIMGSGSTTTMCSIRSWFSDYSPFPSPVQVTLGGHSRVLAIGTGTVLVRMRTNMHWKSTTLKDVIFVPDLQCNILSVARLTHSGGKVQFLGKECQFYDPPGQLICEGRLQGNLYLMDMQPTSPEASHIADFDASPPGGDDLEC